MGMLTSLKKAEGKCPKGMVGKMGSLVLQLWESGTMLQSKFKKILKKKLSPKRIFHMLRVFMSTNGSFQMKKILSGKLVEAGIE